MINVMKRKYIVIMNWSWGVLTVFTNTGIEKSYDCNSDECIWGYFDELPDFDESLLLDSGKSPKYLTLFDFSKNKGVIIPISEEQHDELINDSDKLNELMVEHGLLNESDWMMTDNDEVYFVNI